MKVFTLGSILIAALALTGCGEAPKPPSTAPKPPKPAKIAMFYASPGVAERGEQVNLCYSVEDAVAVRLDPPIEDLKPAYSRCVVFPAKQDRIFTFYAKGADGQEVSERAAVKVVAAKPKPAATPVGATPQTILFFIAAMTTVPKNQPVTLCYGLTKAMPARLEPGGRTLPSKEKACIGVTPEQTTTYKLIAAGDSMTVTVKVE